MIDFKDLAQVIDLDIEQWYVPYILCKQHDAKSRYLKFKLFNRGEPVNIDDTLTVFYCYFRKSDGKEVFSTMTKEDGYLVVELTSQTLAKTGKVEGELVLVQQGSVLTSRPFILDVIKTNTRGTGAFESSNEYDGITEVITRVEELIAQLKDLDTIMVFSHVINVVNAAPQKTISFATFNEYDTRYNLEIHLSGVKLIENVDYTVNKDDRTITAITRDWVNGDQLLLQCFKRGRSAIAGDNTIDATQVNVKPPIIQGANNVYTTLINLNNNLGGDLGRLDTTEKGSLINAINELNTKITNLQNKQGYRRFTRVVALPVPAPTINIDINEYDPNGTDILDVYMQGLRLVENVGYRLNAANKTITCLDGLFDKQVIIEVTKVD